MADRTCPVEVQRKDGTVYWLGVPESVFPAGCYYCDTCGDCLRCSPHGPESWCPTGGRWVLDEDYEDDARIIAAARVSDQTRDGE